MAFSLCGLMLLLGAVALVGLRPWATTAKAPHLSVSPGIGVALGDAVAVSRDRTPRGAGVALAAATPVAASASAPGGPGPRLAVAPLQPVSAVPSPAPAPSPSPFPGQGPSTPAPAPGPVDSGPGAHGPVTAVVEPDEICAGDEYEVLVAFDSTAVAGATLVEMLIRRVGGDVDEDEVHLEGKLSEVLALLEELVSEGDCVRVEVESSGTTPVEGAPEIPGLPDLEGALAPELP